MKAVLMSIQPKWCELIASGKKTVEVRKNKPKLKTPFKVYIYATRPKKWFRFSDFGYSSDELLWLSNGKVEMCDGFKFWVDDAEYESLCGKVIGEFVCDTFITDKTFGHDPLFNAAACLTDADAASYCVNKETYGWHISNLVIYDKPRELGEFIVPSKIGCCNEGKCRGCKYLDRGNGFNLEDDCNAKFSTDEFKPLRRPPQSWCYVERSESDG